jgi:hypothetical protein
VGSFPYFQPLSCGFRIFKSKKRNSPFCEQKCFFSTEENTGVIKFQNFMPISYLRDTFQDKSTRKKIRPNKPFFCGTSTFSETLFLRTTFWWFFLKCSFGSEVSIKFWIFWHIYWLILMREKKLALKKDFFTENRRSTEQSLKTKTKFAFCS